MSLLSKFGIAQARQAASRSASASNGRTNLPLHAPTSTPGPATTPRPARFSNGLKEFLWQLDGIGHGRILDLGAVWQSTVTFFIERDFKIYSEDMMSAWRQFLKEEDEQSRAAVAAKTTVLDKSAGAVAERFLASNLGHVPDSFDAILLWDLLEYLDRETVTRLMARLTTMVRDGGAVLAVFHTKMPEQFCRYRVLDANNLELVPAPALVPPRQVYQNREIQDLFSRFRTVKSFVGRDQLRENVFVK